MSIRTTDTAAVRAALIEGREIALLDVREEAIFAEGHPLFAASLALGRIELEILDRVPRKATDIVIYDDGEGLAQKAAERIAGLGYTNVSLLDGGLAGWRTAGGEIFIDVNVPSKAFGELVEARRHTPSLAAEEVKELIDREADIVILDARRFEEYRTMSIPGGVSVPGAELALRVAALAPDPGTTVIVNCAGRTRSIIGTQSLINAGIPNKVFALRNGTIGWTLAGNTLEKGQTRRFPDVEPSKVPGAAENARALAVRAGARHIDRVQLEALLGEHDRTTYLFDVRTPEEFAAAHLTGFRSAPGGQLVQETDHAAPVRGARIVLADDDGVRANMTASWLAQMNWDVSVLEDGVRGDDLETGAWSPRLPAFPKAETITPAGLDSRLRDGSATVVDLAPSTTYLAGHIPGARYAVRSLLSGALLANPAGQQIVLASDDAALARFAASDLAQAGLSALVLEGGTRAWTAAGLPLETGPTDLATPIIDRYRRPYEGTDNAASAMQAYLDWEYGLVEQLRRDGTHGFVVI
jgi:rhodanese-related sulfurtransferase